MGHLFAKFCCMEKQFCHDIKSSCKSDCCFTSNDNHIDIHNDICQNCKNKIIAKYTNK